MVRRAFLVALALAGAGGVHRPAFAQEASPLTVRQAWSRATPGGATLGAGYLEIRNAGTTPDRLIGVTSDIGGRTEIHESVMEGAVARMRPVEGLEIPAKGGAELKPGGYHLMFMGLKRPLREGERFRATLRFERAGPVEAEFAVRGVGAAQGSPPHAH